jgi:hypothetical protein
MPKKTISSSTKKVVKKSVKKKVVKKVIHKKIVKKKPIKKKGIKKKTASARGRPTVVRKNTSEEKMVIKSIKLPSKKRRYPLKAESSLSEKVTHITEDELLNIYKDTKVDNNEKQINKELTSIYKNGDGTFPDMTHFEKKKRRRFITSLFLFILSIGFFLAVLWGAFFFFESGKDFSEGNIILSISGESESVLGGEVRYRVRYRNEQNTLLEHVEIKIHYPEGFVYKESSRDTKGELEDTWELGVLQPYESGYLDIYGNIFGDKDKEQSFRVFLNYNPENFSSQFQQAANTNIVISESPVLFTVDMEDESIFGDDVVIHIVVEKEGDFSPQLSLSLNENEFFSIKESSIESVPFNEVLWELPEFESKLEIDIVGVFTGDNDVAQLAFQLQGVEDSGNEYIYGDIEREVALVKTDFIANYVINGARKELEVKPGETLNTTVSLKNDGDVAIDDIKVIMRFEAPSYNKKSILNWGYLTDEYNGKIVGEQINETQRRGIITWDDRQIKELSSIEPGEKFLFDVSLPIKSSDDITLTDFTSFLGNAFIEVQFERDGVTEIVSTKPIDLIFNSDVVLDMSSEVEDDTYSVNILVQNNFHELKDLSVKFDVFGDIELSEDDFIVPAGKVAYDKEKQHVVWSVDSLPLEIDILALQFNFDFKSKNPTQTDITSNIVLEAVDTITGKTVMLVKDGLKFDDLVIEL